MAFNSSRHRARRKEDLRFITGRGHYTDDVRIQGMLHAAIVRSPYSRARIHGVDFTAATDHPDVIAVFDAQAIAKFVNAIPERTGSPDMVQVNTFPLAREYVRYVGEPVAVVIATDQYAARDALDLVVVNYEPLEADTDLQAASGPESEHVHEQLGTNRAYTWSRVHGDVSAAFDEADVVITQSMENQRLFPAAMETRSVVAEPSSDGYGVTVTTSTQTPHTIRTQLSTALGLPESGIRVIAPDVGGGFGAKIRAYPEDAIIPAVAMRLGRPVKWTGTRSEDLIATHHGRAQHAEVSLSAMNDGTITGLRLRGLADLGAYPRGARVPTFTGILMNGVYRIPNVDLEIEVSYTNTMATGAYRGAGRPEAAYYVERCVDILARKLDIDPVEIRRKNFIASSDFPYATASGAVYDSGDYAGALDELVRVADYEGLRKHQSELRQQGRIFGIGITTFTELCGLGGGENAHLRIERDGSATLATGISPHGQGQETTFAELVASELPISSDRVRVIHSDTDRTPPGAGTFGSRGHAVGGSAVLKAVEKINRKISVIASDLLECAPGDIESEDDRYFVRGTPERSVSWSEIVQHAYGSFASPDGDGGLEVLGNFQPEGYDFPFGAHLATVEIDPATGDVQVLKYVSVDDCGNVFSPALVDGQVHGAVAQGVSQALWEEAVYERSGQLLTGSFMDYALPRSTSLPAIETHRTVTPSPLNPLGAKGIGELGTVGATPTIVNAVLDALAPFGVHHIDMPLRPEKVWQAIRDSEHQR